MNVPPTILLVTCLILGLYILGQLGAAWLWPAQDCAHNIGCYLADRNLNKSAELHSRIEGARHSHSIAHSKAYAYPSLVGNESKLHQNSLELAHTFEAYLQRLTQRQNDLTENFDILTARSRAQDQYDSCRREIEREFAQVHCLENWDDYERKCFARMGDARGILNELAKEADELRDKISQWVKLPESSQSDVEWARKIYRERMDNNTKFRDDLTGRIDRARASLGKQKADVDEAFEKTRLVNQSYLECASNRKEFRACQEITNEVRSINAQTLQDLKEMIDGKRQLLTSLMEFLRGQQGSKDMQHLNEVYNRQMAEYKSMMKEYISYSRETQKACGCTEEEEQEYKRQLEKLTASRDHYLVQIALLQAELSQAEAHLRGVEAERQEIFEEYRRAVQKSEGGDPKGSQLKRLNQQLLDKNAEIGRLRGHYQGIFSECDEVKARMAERVHNIDAITDCLAKKHYYYQLLAQSQQYLNPDSEPARIGELKAELRKQLGALKA